MCKNGPEKQPQKHMRWHNGMAHKKTIFTHVIACDDT